ncbi:transcriptional regulator [Mycobacterium triplex]|uniref:Transcriptional regulator n=1 Tax=Mycobacterium triplex TaxID=47839 RepID=A0A024K0U3_9MYCO|nr:TetR/AcrR family transcriptional regulator [Mycobacterium triplex]ORX05105.1 transcriptional regulator [Mycobacterium triplex]CDO89118.1 TetR family transcriptional regulator [Mycobacterium triplex]
MSRDDWVVGGDRHATAAERIFAAATDLVSREGLDALDIDTLAATVHCSRATIYRYAGGKAQIRDAVTLRIAERIIGTVRRAVEGLSGPERVLVAIGVALEQIRTVPTRHLMLVSTVADLTGLHASSMLSQIAAELAGIATDDEQAAQWIVRVVISMSHWPPSNTAAEQDMLRRFVLPAFEAGLKQQG